MKKGIINSPHNNKKSNNTTTAKLESSKLSKSTNVQFTSKNKLKNTNKKAVEINNLVSLIQNNKIVEREHHEKSQNNDRLRSSSETLKSDKLASIKTNEMTPKNEKLKAAKIIQKASINLETNKPLPKKESLKKQNSLEVKKRSNSKSSAKSNSDNSVKSSNNFSPTSSIKNLLNGLKVINPIDSLNSNVFNILKKSDNRLDEPSSNAKKMLLSNNINSNLQLLAPPDRKAIVDKLKGNPIQLKPKLVEINCSNVVGSGKSVKEYAYKEDRNNRNYMEDFSKVIDKFLNDPSKGLFTLYDGHGGTEVAVFSKEKMPDVLGKLIKENPINLEKNFGIAFQKVDEELKTISSEDRGCTATVVYIFKENDIYQLGRRILYCANVGDSRCILVSQDKEQGYVKRLSYDHKATDENEVDRIRKNGGVVFNNRIYGQLAVARSLGDHALKRYGVSNQPYISKSIVTDKDKYCIMASDGVWDVLNDEEAMELALKCTSCEEVSSILIKQAALRGSNDNISCLTIRLN